MGKDQGARLEDELACALAHPEKTQGLHKPEKTLAECTAIRGWEGSGAADPTGAGGLARGVMPMQSRNPVMVSSEETTQEHSWMPIPPPDAGPPCSLTAPPSPRCLSSPGARHPVMALPPQMSIPASQASVSVLPTWPQGLKDLR